MQRKQWSLLQGPAAVAIVADCTPGGLGGRTTGADD